MTENDKLSVLEIIDLAKNNGLLLASKVALKMAEAFEGETRDALKDLAQKLIAMTTPNPRFDEADKLAAMVADNVSIVPKVSDGV